MAPKKKKGYIYAAAGEGRHRLDAAALCIGDGICISVWGGDRPHIGSVAIAAPRSSLKTPRKRSATSSVFNFTGHKDEPVARAIAEQAAARFDRNIVVTAGIHLERMTRRDLAVIMNNAGILAGRLIQELERRLRP